MAEHPVIWLAPGCDGDCVQDRCWADQDAWGPCEECGAMPVKYVLAPDQPTPKTAQGE